jgi:hypothetical protein
MEMFFFVSFFPGSAIQNSANVNRSSKSLSGTVELNCGSANSVASAANASNGGKYTFLLFFFLLAIIVAYQAFSVRFLLILLLNCFVIC